MFLLRDAIERRNASPRLTLFSRADAEHPAQKKVDRTAASDAGVVLDYLGFSSFFGDLPHDLSKSHRLETRLMARHHACPWLIPDIGPIAAQEPPHHR